VVSRADGNRISRLGVEDISDTNSQPLRVEIFIARRDHLPLLTERTVRYIYTMFTSKLVI
jgi:hypothetical protein